MTLKKYIGITGITRLEEIDWINEILKHHPKILEQRQIMLGFIMNDEFANNYYIFNKSHKKVTIPQLNALIGYCEKVLPNQDNYLKIVHYSSKSPFFESELDKIKQSVKGLDGIQLNIHLPNLIEMEHIKQKYPDFKIIYQLKPQFIGDIKDVFESWYPEMIESLKKSVDYFLIDPSEGKNFPNDLLTITLTKGWFDLYEFTNEFGFAGGLNQVSLDTYSDIIKEYSIDAQSGLRDEKTNKIDFNELKYYLLKAIKLILKE